MNTKTYHIKGTVINDKTGRGVKGLRIEAWDKDLLIDDFLGTALTSDEGAFSIVFDTAKFGEFFFDNKPDIYFKVYQEDQLIKDTTDSVLWNIKEREKSVTIKVAPEGLAPDPGEEVRNAIEAKVSELSRIVKLGKARTAKLMAQNLDPELISPEEWTRLETEKILTAKQITALKDAVDLSRLSSDNFPLVEALSAAKRSPKDLIVWETPDWGTFLKNNKIAAPQGESTRVYAENMRFNLEQTYPSHVLMHRMTDPGRVSPKIDRLPDLQPLYKNNTTLIKNGKVASLSWKGIADEERKKIKQSLNEVVAFANTYRYLEVTGIVNDAKLTTDEKQQTLQASLDRFQLFYRNNPELDLRFVNFFDPAVKNTAFNWKDIPDSRQTGIKKQLMAFQRVMNLSDGSITTQKLLANGLDSSTSIATMSYKKFKKSSGLADTQAKMVYRKAKENALQLTHDFGMIQDIHGLFKEIATGNLNKKLVNDLKEIDGFDQLFGSQDFCECEHCRSILSPAAYFTDLMRFIEKNISDEVFAAKTGHPLYLKRRRPDLWKLQLSCENTHTLIPYLDIVNDVLTQYLQNVVPAVDIFKKLSEENNSFSLPFHLPLAETRIYLKHFNTSLHELYSLLEKTPEAVWREQLEISADELNVITTADTAGIKARYGDPSATVLSAFDVQDFIKIVGISRDELDHLLRIRFFPDLSNIKIIKKQEANELQVFSETLKNLTEERLDHIHRFIRLWKKLPWSIKETDLVLTSLKEAGLIADLDKDTIIYMGRLSDIQQQLKLSVEELCTIFHLLPDTALQDGKKSLFERLFMPEKLFNGGNSTAYYHAGFNTVNPSDNTTDPKTPLLLSGLGISETELLSLLNFLQDQIDFDNTGNCTLNRGKLSWMYRHVKVAKALKWKMKDLFHALQLHFSPSAHFIDSLEKIHTIMEFKPWLKSSPFSVDELWFILKGEESGVLKYVNNITTASGIVQEIQASGLLTFNPETLTAINDIRPAEAESILQQMETDGLLSTSNNGVTYSLTPLYQLNQDLSTVFSAISAPAHVMDQEDAIREKLNGFHPASVLSGILSNRLNLSREMFALATRFVAVDLEDPGFFAVLNASFTDSQPDNPAALSILVDFLRLFERVRLLIGQLRLKEEDLDLIVNQSAVFNISDPSQLSLEHIIKITFYKQLRPDATLSSRLRETLQNYQSSTGFNPQDMATLAELWRQSSNLIQSLAETLSLSTNPLDALKQLEKGIKVCNRMGINGHSLQKLGLLTFGELTEARDIILGAFSAKYDDEEDRRDTLEPYNDKINLLKRDALCDYIISKEKTLKFRDRNDLYKFFLLDVDMGDCFRTSKIVAGISSLQLYIHRCLINLEQSASDTTKVDPDLIPRKEWEWMKNYRVWEANRKVFLYPENYIFPDLRDNKTPIFKELEDELLQEKITQASAEAAYKKYLARFGEVAKLKIAGSHYAKDSNTYYFFGRTPADPPQYYYRKFANAREWTPWTKLELGINAGYVSAMEFKGKLYLFWVDTNYQEKNSLKNGDSEFSHHEYNIHLQYSFLNEFNEWAPARRLENLYPSNPVEFGLINDGIRSAEEIFDEFSISDLTYHMEVFEKSKIYNKVFPYIKNDHIHVRYAGRRLAFSAFDLELDFYRNELAKGAEPDNLPQKNVVKLYQSGGKVALGLGKNTKNAEPNLDRDGGYTSSTNNLEILTNEFSSQEFHPDFTIVHNKYGDFIFELGEQQFLIRELNFSRGMFRFRRRTMLRLSSSLSDKFAETLFYEGLDGLLALYTQKETEHLDISFTKPYRLTAPSDHKKHIDVKGAYGTYYRELFFHIPFLIANHLNANQKFKDAKYWYEKIFDPTASENPEPEKPTDRNWRYIEFRDMDIPKMREILTDTQAIATYKKDPFNPHAIARLRLSAYQKTIVMKYIDNLLDWGDHLFAQDTMESINEATMLYLFAADILGPHPVKTGKCETADPDRLTYEELGPAIGKGSEFLLELENWSWGNLIVKEAKPLGLSSAIATASPTLNPSDSIASVTTGSRSLAGPNAGTASPASAEAFRAAIYALDTYKEVATMRKDREESVKKWTPDKHFAVVPGLNMMKQKSSLAFCIPPNEDLLKYWERVEDRLFKIRNCMNMSGVRRSLALFQPPIDPMLLVRARAAGLSLEDILAGLSEKLPPYRFGFLIEKAKQFTATVQGFGGALLSALEKKDAEELARLNNTHQQEILNMVKETKKQQLNEVLAQLESTRAAKQNVQNKIDHFNRLIDEGLTGWEITQQISKHTATGFKIAEGSLHLLGIIHYLFPQIGSPFAMKYGGKELGDSITESAAMLASLASIFDAISASAGLEAGFQRREEEWEQQLKLAEQEMKQMIQQEIAAQIRVDIAANELEVHKKNIEQAEEIEEFYKNKFTNLGLYNYLSVGLNRLYREAYNLAYDMAGMAEKVYRFERNESDVFIAGDNWKHDRAGLLAGERLLLQLQQMEKKYIETDVRKPEITQSFSMALLDASELVKLRQTGSCIIKIPEIAFEVLYPGQYRRRIKSVRLSIPCIAGPHTNVGARLTLLKGEFEKEDGDTLQELEIAKNTSISTSSANNDAGVFELNFRDERYLPFEGAGAISEWRLELPSVVRSFDYNSISDVILHMSYTAEEGDRISAENEMADAVTDYAANHGLHRLFSLKHEFSNAYHQLLNFKNGQQTSFAVNKHHFPYMLADKDLVIDKTSIYLKPKKGMEVSTPATLKINNGNTIWNPGDDIAMPGSSGATDTLKAGAVSLSGSPVKNWDIEANSNDLDESVLDDILILITYNLT